MSMTLTDAARNAARDPIVTHHIGTTTWQGPRSEAPKVAEAGDLISRDAAIANAQEQKAFYDETASTGNPSQSFVAGRMSAACESIIKVLYALPADPEVGKAERLRAELESTYAAWSRERAIGERAEARLAEAEVENKRRQAYVDAALVPQPASEDAQAVAYAVAEWVNRGESDATVEQIAIASVEAFKRVQASLATQGEPVDLIDAATVADAIENAEGVGIWRSCSGCHETNDGQPTGPYSPALQCHLGVGCTECGGLGAVWDTTDYGEMADWLAEELVADADRSAAPASAGVTVKPLLLPEARDLWKQHGGRVTGPRVETWSMPEANVLAFLAALTTAQSAEGGGVGADQRAVTERMSRRRYASPTAPSAEGGE